MLDSHHHEPNKFTGATRNRMLCVRTKPSSSLYIPLYSPYPDGTFPAEHTEGLQLDNAVSEWELYFPRKKHESKEGTIRIRKAQNTAVHTRRYLETNLNTMLFKRLSYLHPRLICRNNLQMQRQYKKENFELQHELKTSFKAYTTRLNTR